MATFIGDTRKIASTELWLFTITKTFQKIRLESKWNTAFQVISFSGTYPGAMESLKRQPSCFTGRDIQTDICVPFLQSNL